MKTKLNIIRILLAGMLLFTVSCWDGFNDTLMGNDNVDPAEVVLTSVEFDDNADMTVSWTAPTMQNYSDVYIIYSYIDGSDNLITGYGTPGVGATSWITPADIGVAYTVTVKARYSSGFESKGQTFTVTATAGTGWGFINTVAALKGLHNNNYILLKDLDLGGDAWVPITSYTGQFNGNGHTISNIYINKSDSRMGLFGSLDNADIVNLNLVNVSITGGTFTGALAGSVEDSRITNCHISGNVSGGKPTGGFAGEIYLSIINNCSFTGSVTGSGEDAGGFVGQLATSNLTGCWFSGNVNVTGTNSDIGGFAGSINKPDAIAFTLNNCHALCTITSPGGSKVGGFAGYVSSISENLLTIQNCYAVGTVTGAGDVGGFAGNTGGSQTYPVTITQCYSTVNVTGTGTNTGGFVGYTVYADITDCYCTGIVQGFTNVGGFVGNLNRDTNSIATCYTACEVSGSSNVGGFGGLLQRNPLNCYFMDSSYSNGTGMTYLDETARYILGSYSGFDQSTVWARSSSINSGLPYLKDLVP